MKVTEHVFANRGEFQANTPFGVLKRVVYNYAIKDGEDAYLIDTGVAPQVEEILAFIEECGIEKEAVCNILISHCHADHIGGLKLLKEHFSCPVSAPEEECAWIEDIDAQFANRPVPDFYRLVAGPVPVELRLADGIAVKLKDGKIIAYAIPGHCKGQMAFFYTTDGVLFSADGIPVEGEAPVYDDVVEEVRSIRRMRKIEGVHVLLMSWAEPIVGQAAVDKAFDDALAYIQKIHTYALEGIASTDGSAEAVAKYVHAKLRLPASELTKYFIQSIASHIKNQHIADLLA